MSFTQEQIVAAARALCNRTSEACNTNADDEWTHYSDSFKEDARVALEAAAGITGDGRGEAEWYTGLDRHGVRHFYHRTEGRPSEFNDPLYATPPQQEQAAPAWEMPDAPDLFKLINSQSILQSLLYDLNLLPECCRDAMQWHHMVTICGHFEMALKKAAPGAVQDGFVRVPVVATKEMCKAAVIFANGNAVYKNVAAGALEVEEQIYGEAYAAMIAAAPKAQEPGA